MGTFDGQVAWITGGGSGIGRACALELASQGATVVVSGRRVERLHEVVEAVEAAGGAAVALPVDVTHAAACEGAVDEILDTCGRLDLVLANAGFGVMGKVADLTEADWRRQFDVNLFGVVNTIRPAIPHVVAQGGRIGLVGSVAAWARPRKNAAYSASKAAIAALGQTLSAELAGTGATCTTLHPGLVTSEIGQVDNKGRFHDDKQDKRPQAVMWPTDRAARVMVGALAKRKREFVFTGHGRFIVFVNRHLPRVGGWLSSKL